MIILNNVSIALDALKASRTRSYLTMLGIVVGTGAIVCVISLAEGIKQSVFSQANQLSPNLIVVRPGSSENGVLSTKTAFRYSPLSPYATTTLTEQDITTIKALPSTQAAAPLMLLNGSVRHGKATSQQATILATTPEFAPALGAKLTDGQFIDENTGRDTVVIGHQLAIDLYGTDHPIGEQLKIRGRDHTIIGILKNNSGPLGINGTDLNQAAIISLDDGKSFNQGIAQIQQINIIPRDKKAKQEITQTLLTNHSNEADFSVLSGKEAAAISKSFYDFVATVTAIIASISLVVGGIGIMNIMLVGVAERTREIGVRKSLGASNRHILWQFLIEALIISTVGGVVGVAVGYTTALFAGVFIDTLPILNWVTLGSILLLSITIGIIFGIVPALKAARKDPIEALRQHS